MEANIAHRVEVLFVLLFSYMRTLKQQKLDQMAASAADKLKQNAPAMVK